MTRQFIILQAWLKDMGERAHSERGATAVEYGLMVALIAVAILVTVGLLGTQLNRLFNEVVTALTAIA